MRTVFLSRQQRSGLGGRLFLMGVVEYFDQAIFQFETFMEQATQLLEFLGNTLAGITQIGERQQFLSDDINARVKSLGQFQPTLVIEGFRLFGQLLIDTEMASRRVVHQHATEFLQRLAILSQRLGLGAKSIKGPSCSDGMSLRFRGIVCSSVY